MIDAHNHLGEAYFQKHMNEQAIAELQKAVTLSGGSPRCMATLVRAYVAAGRTPEAEALLGDLKKRSSPGQSYASEIAAMYTALGASDQAMRFDLRARDDRSPVGLLRLRRGFRRGAHRARNLWAA